MWNKKQFGVLLSNGTSTVLHCIVTKWPASLTASYSDCRAYIQRAYWAWMGISLVFRGGVSTHWEKGHTHIRSKKSLHDAIVWGGHCSKFSILWEFTHYNFSLIQIKILLACQKGSDNRGCTVHIMYTYFKATFTQTLVAHKMISPPSSRESNILLISTLHTRLN